MRAHRRGAALLLALGLALTACGDDAAEDPAADDVEAESPDDTVDDAADAEAGDDAAETADEGAATLGLSDTDLGEVLVDAEGMTLYVFDADEQGESTCYDDCEANWPPLVEEDPTAGEGVDESLLGTAPREDGSEQVTYDGWPLYTWAADEEPGDVNGQGVGDVWWVIDAAGEPQRDAGTDTDDTANGAADEEGSDGEEDAADSGASRY